MADPPTGTHFHGPAHIGIVVGGNVGTVNLPPVVIPTAHEIAAPPSDFVGRATECSGLIETLIQQAHRGGAVALIHGLGGVGKTALALRVAYLLRGAFPRQVRLDLAGAGTSAMSSEAALGSAIRALGYDPQLPLPDTLDELQRRYNSLVAGQPTLILADNAAGVAQVKPLLPPPGSALLVTSRQRFALPGAAGPADVDLAVLPQPDAETLLLAICDRIGDQAAALAKLCGCLPLALRISASLLATTPRSVPGYLQTLADTRTKLQALRDPRNPDDPEANVAAAFTLSYDALDPAAQDTLAQLSVFPAPFDEPAATAVVALPPAATPVADHLELLHYRSLLDWDGTARYSLHDLVRAFAAGKLPAPDAVALRHAEFYAVVAWQADKLYKTKDGMGEGLALFDGERLHIDAGWAWAHSHTPSDTAATVLMDYADATAYIGDLRYHKRTERIPQLEAGLTAARRLGRKDAEGALLGNLGIAYTDLGEVRRAIGYHEQVLTIMREIGDRRGEGNALGNLGTAYAYLGEVRRAIGYYEQVLTIMREMGNQQGEGSTLGSLGSAYTALGEPRQAIGYYEQALTIMREIGDRRGEGSTLGSLG
ncbi:MAG: tetratricopeptide repeat protein, partial [Chloroflexota bacterium]|nr:tetratricopeptide repeat protein [Chloroflexota bacterium]